MADIAVLGAGITGVTTAYQLNAMGHDVTVYDRQRYAAMETSFANGGQLSASNAEVWTALPTVLKGLKWLLRKDAPLLVRPTPTWHKISWMAEFLAAIPHYRQNTVETARLAIAARSILAEMAEVTGAGYDRRDCGILHFYEKTRDLDWARRVNGMLTEAGLDRREIAADEVRARCPQLHADPVGGFFTPSDATGDIHLFTAGVARWLERAGTSFEMGAPIRARGVPGGVEIDRAGVTHRHDAVVVCAGVGSRAIARDLGDRVNVYPVKGYSITVMLDDPASRLAAPQVSLLDDAAKIVTSRLGEDRFRVAGTAEFAGEDRDIRADRVRPLVDWVEARFPGVSTETVVPWAGLRPMMPDMMPRVGRGRRAGVFYNTGHGHLGWTLSAATAAAVAQAVTAEHPGRPSRPAAPARRPYAVAAE